MPFTWLGFMTCLILCVGLLSYPAEGLRCPAEEPRPPTVKGPSQKNVANKAFNNSSELLRFHVQVMSRVGKWVATGSRCLVVGGRGWGAVGSDC